MFRSAIANAAMLAAAILCGPAQAGTLGRASDTVEGVAGAQLAMPTSSTAPSDPVVTRNNPDIDSILPLAHDSRTPAGGVTTDWLVGLVVFGSDNKPIGRITRVRDMPSDGDLPTIIVQIDAYRSVQLRNAIADIRPDGVWLVITALAVQSRAVGRMTKLSISG